MENDETLEVIAELIRQTEAGAIEWEACVGTQLTYNAAMDANSRTKRHLCVFLEHGGHVTLTHELTSGKEPGLVTTLCDAWEDKLDGGQNQLHILLAACGEQVEARSKQADVRHEEDRQFTVRALGRALRGEPPIEEAGE